MCVCMCECARQISTGTKWVVQHHKKMCVCGCVCVCGWVYGHIIYKPCGELFVQFLLVSAAPLQHQQAAWAHNDGCWLSVSHWPQVLLHFICNHIAKIKLKKIIMKLKKKIKNVYFFIVYISRISRKHLPFLIKLVVCKPIVFGSVVY